ncbi:MAG: hypothetical protein JSW41_05460 [Candidatus Aenigmatarchaeota archaeon]|nr:MAG: hypothetical protein JSW41_05460 [Candidatus Aenigmarchaeota archaeon]
MARRRTTKQKRAAKRNIAKARRKWQKMGPRKRAKAMPGGKGPIRKRGLKKRRKR